MVSAIYRFKMSVRTGSVSISCANLALFSVMARETTFVTKLLITAARFCSYRGFRYRASV